MTTVIIANFAGMQPIIDASLLQDSNAQYAENTWLYRGLIRGLRHAMLAHRIEFADTQQVYRIPLNTDNPPDFTDAGSLWLEYPDPYMSTIRNPTINDQYNRYYFFPSDQYDASGANPSWPEGGAWTVVPQYASYDPTTGVMGPLLTLGIPVPVTPPDVTPAAAGVTTTATAATPPNNSSLTVASTAGVLVGMYIDDTTVTTTTAVTNAATAINTTVLHFGSTSGILVGMKAADSTNSAAILMGTTVASVTTTTVTLSTVVLSPGVSAGDTITFTNSNQIPTDASVQSISGAVVTMNTTAAYAGVLVGDSITFSTPLPETRAYVYTYVSAYSEEGPPSPATLGTGDPTGSWTITVYNPTADLMADRNLTAIRIYRTVTDSAGNASYYQVTQMPISGAPGAAQTYIDSALPNDITANQQLQTVDFTGPPSDLQGVVLMANGIAAGFSNKREVWFSAAYQLWAWPAAYALAVEYPIVGLTASGSSLNVMTEGPPYIITGITPNTMAVLKVSANEPCISRGSIAISQEGAYYASPNGIMELSPSGDNNITSTVYEKEFHFSLQPWTWAAGRYGESYVAFSKGAGIPGIDPDGDTLSGLVIDNQDPNVMFSFLHFNNHVINLYQDELSGQLFGTLNNGSVMQWNPPVGVPGTTTLWNWEWKSKKFRFTMPQQFKAFLVFFDVPPEVQITLGPRNTDPHQIFNPATQYLIVQIYADGTLLTTREVQTSGEVLLINHGSKWTYWEVRLQGQVQVRMFKMASSVKELRAA